MPFNLLLFPIIGGYYVLIRSELFRYRQQRVEFQKLITNSILVGVVLVFISWVFTRSITLLFPDFVKSVVAQYPMKVNYFGTAICSFLLAVGFTEFTNLFTDEDKQISKAIDKIGNEFERLLDHCYRNSEMIHFTLKTDKCYIGWLQSLPIPSNENYVRIFPVYSGYRDPDSKKLVLTTQYLDVYATYVKDGDVTNIVDLTTLVIRIDEIVTANRFNPDMWDRFQNQGEAQIVPKV